jgi:hypothetical protein
VRGTYVRAPLIVDQLAVIVTDSDGGPFFPAHWKIDKILKNYVVYRDSNYKLVLQCSRQYSRYGAFYMEIKCSAMRDFVVTHPNVIYIAQKLP